MEHYGTCTSLHLLYIFFLVSFHNPQGVETFSLGGFGGVGVLCFFGGFGWFGGVDICIKYHKIMLRTYFYLPIPQLNSGQKSYRKP